MIDRIELLKKGLTGELHEESFWRPIRPTSVRASSAAKQLLLRKSIEWLERRGCRVFLPIVPDANARQWRELGKDHPIVGFTMVGRKRLDNVEACVREVERNGVAGAFVECGVWRGGVGILAKAVLAELGSDRSVWLCDSFRGLPPPTFEQDAGYDFCDMNDYLGVSRDRVAANFGQFGLLDERVHFLEGFFSDTLATADIGEIAVLRLDGDLYESTWQGLVALFPKVSRGGYVIIDDYGVLEPCRRAVHDFLAREKLNPELIDIDGTGVYWRVG
ncbi:MAG: class I SAM-dependent methyltransferase [Rhodanobacteraceae bacterium]|nr:class I SAM-dependent methyltransferase [Rhodanobacteraceae bacterium]